MSKILYNDEWYESVSSTALYEDEFERLVLSRSVLLYPNYLTTQFKKVVQSDTDATEPDMALIDIQYRIWWIIEVEMTHHSLRDHVLPQVEILSKAKYGESEADYLLAQDTRLERDKLVDMMKGIQPRVLVIVNGPSPAWKEPLIKLNALLQIIEVFRSEKNHHIVRINGENPTMVQNNLVSMCHADTGMPRLLVVSSPAGLGITQGQKCEIEFEGGLTEWERIDSSTGVWLNPLRRSPLNSEYDYLIIRDEIGALHFQTIGRRRV